MVLKGKWHWGMLILLVGTFFFSRTALAGSIVIKGIQDRNGRAVAGMEIDLYQVGDFNSDNSSYKVDEAYKGILNDENLNSFLHANGNELRNLTLSLEAIAKSKALAHISRKTDTDGRAAFEGLEKGLYLVSYQTSGRFSSLPSLLTIPQYDTGINGETVEAYDLEVSGKVEESPDSHPVHNEPNVPNGSSAPEVPDTSAGTTGETFAETTESSPVEYETDNQGNVMGVGRLKKGKDGKLYDDQGRVRGVWRTAKTGDESHMRLYGVLAVASLGAIIFWLLFVQRIFRDKR